MTTQIAIPTQTMSSHEIAELCEKRHDHVLRDIRKMMVDLVDSGHSPDLGNLTEHKDQRGFTSHFDLDRNLTLTLVSGYNVALRHRIVKRLDEMEQAVRGGMLHSVQADINMRALGGMLKGIVNKQLTELLPALVNEQLLTGDRRVIQGMSALEVAEKAGYTKGKRPKGLTQFITGKLLNYHIRRKFFPERSPHGSANVWVYNPAVVKTWLSEGGQAEIDNYAAKKSGQGSFRLVKG